MLKYRFKWVALWIIIITNVSQISLISAQTLEQTVDLANTEFDNHDYVNAISNYQRVFFFDESQKYPYIHEKLATCYLYEKDINKALFEYEIAYNLETSDSLKNELAFKKVLLLIIQNNYLEANFELLSLPDSLTSSFIQRRLFYQGVISLQLDSVTNAKNQFLAALEPTDSIGKLKIETLFAKYKPNKPNPKTAKWLSTFVPGLGQFYIGDYKNAVNSFVLSGALITLLFTVAINYTFIDAMASVVPYFQRYYFGGLNRAKKGAYEKQEENRKKILNQIITVFEQKSIAVNSVK